MAFLIDARNHASHAAHIREANLPDRPERMVGRAALKHFPGHQRLFAKERKLRKREKEPEEPIGRP